MINLFLPVETTVQKSSPPPHSQPVVVREEMSLLLLTGVVRVKTLIVENLQMILRQLPGHGSRRDSLQGIDAAVEPVLTDDLVLLPSNGIMLVKDIFTLTSL